MCMLVYGIKFAQSSCRRDFSTLTRRRRRVIMKTHFKGFLASVACAAFAMAFAPQARATAELKISDGTNTIDIVDNGTATCTGAVTGCADANPSVNVVTYIGTIGTWSLNVSTGS